MVHLGAGRQVQPRTVIRRAITVASTAPICGICSMPRIPTG
ncbi:hypothetical protein MBELCI_2813 [Limimaricola cinnabarinus LL-001]|uniref:Uncharacterized protein n=1 Tax=Limimaricola cinnabarinus LL-001 TaxID=1337093 RepID=U2YNB2_9RHOB|nr:hypothetical protein MBELCI_2813 [Limimaricola cinnabarinus LL-001]